MVQLKEKNKDNSIPVYELKDGQIGVITQWSALKYLGVVVQIIGDRLIIIGSDEIWGGVPKTSQYRVRILPEGTELIITNNQ